jgi:hypothetical protein
MEVCVRYQPMNSVSLIDYFGAGSWKCRWLFTSSLESFRSAYPKTTLYDHTTRPHSCRHWPMGRKAFYFRLRDSCKHIAILYFFRLRRSREALQCRGEECTANCPLSIYKQIHHIHTLGPLIFSLRVGRSDRALVTKVFYSVGGLYRSPKTCSSIALISERPPPGEGDFIKPGKQLTECNVETMEPSQRVIAWGKSQKSQKISINETYQSYTTARKCQGHATLRVTLPQHPIPIFAHNCQSHLHKFCAFRLGHRPIWIDVDE